MPHEANSKPQETTGCGGWQREEETTIPHRLMKSQVAPQEAYAPALHTVLGRAIPMQHWAFTLKERVKLLHPAGSWCCQYSLPELFSPSSSCGRTRVSVARAFPPTHLLTPITFFPPPTSTKCTRLFCSSEGKRTKFVPPSEREGGGGGGGYTCGGIDSPYPVLLLIAASILAELLCRWPTACYVHADRRRLTCPPVCLLIHPLNSN